MHEGREHWGVEQIVGVNAGSGKVVVVALALFVVASAEESTSIYASESLASLDHSLFPSSLIPFYYIAARCPHSPPRSLSPSSTMSSLKIPSLSSSPLAVVVAIAFRVVSRCETGSDLEPSAILTCQDCIPDSK